MKKTLYLMRHGQTLFNSLKKIQGACDSPLTQTGIMQANVAKQYFDNNGITFDKCYCSTQERASDTLEIITNKPYTRLKGIKEWEFGLFEGESESLNPKTKPGQTSYEDYFVAYGGESSVEVQNRMYQTLKDAMDKEDHNQVLAVSHGGAIYMFYQKFEDVTIKPVKLSNCAILKFEYENGNFQFIECIEHQF